MKKTILSFFTLILFFSLTAQVNYKLNENNYHKISISFTFENLQAIDIDTDEGSFSRIYLNRCVKSNPTGEPELPVSVNMLEIPIFGDYVLNVYGKEFEIFDAYELGIDNPVYPRQPSVSKSHEGNVAFYQNKTTYQTDAFYALPLARFEEAGVMRNVNLGKLYVSPVQYNPVTNQIKLYKAIDVEILFKKVELLKTQAKKDLHRSILFHPIHVINPLPTHRAEFSNTPVKYLMVAHAMFRGELEPFIAWKKRKGFLVEIGYTDDENVGTTTSSIANFIKSHYEEATPDNPAPTFVLLVGDVEQIPTFTGKYGNHPTDLYYFTWEDGNLPCCYYGRFSAQNVNQLLPQIEKTLQYEQFTMPDANYLNDAVLVAGYDNEYSAVYANGQLNYLATNYLNTNYGYNKVFKHPHPCSLQATQIRAEIGAGVGFANYSAHGTVQGWYSPSFTSAHIPQMNNENKYGLMIGNCCESSNFKISQCFGEALLRVPKKGAVGYIGGSNYTYWDEDYYWAIGVRNLIDSNPSYDPTRLGAFDKLFHSNGEVYNQWMTTFGAMIVAGNAAVETSDSDMKQYYWEIYNLMGDPSVMTYLTKPSRMSVEIDQVIPFGDSTLSAKVAPFAYCALTDSNRDIVSAGFADANGNIRLSFPPMEVHHKFEFAAWAQKYVQYFKTVYSGYVSIQENDKTTGCLVYPNPTTGELRFEIRDMRNEICDIKIFDVYGREIVVEISNLNTQISNLQIDISHLQSGVYFVKIETETGTITQKIMKL
jgi:hypothetical protein